MRRITLWALSTLTSLVLLFSYHTSTSSTTASAASPIVAQANVTPAPSATTGSSSSGSSSSGSTATPKATATTPKATTQTTTKTYAGSAVDTQYGPVQVQITVRNGKIIAASVLQVPSNNGRDQEINSVAVPQLNSEVVQAQSASIDMVSGATFTSQGYLQSLQSAIDQAHL